MSTASRKAGDPFHESPASFHSLAALSRSRRLPPSGGSGQVGISGAWARPQLGHCQPEGTGEGRKPRGDGPGSGPIVKSNTGSYLCLATHIGGLFVGGREIDVHFSAERELFPRFLVERSNFDLTRRSPFEKLLIFDAAVYDYAKFDSTKFFAAIKKGFIAVHSEFCSYHFCSPKDRTSGHFIPKPPETSFTASR